MKTIKKLVLCNFKRFELFEVDFDARVNVLIGDNESGKSSILLALDLTLSGSRSKIETIGLETLFNKRAIADFLDGGRRPEDLPRLFVEVYLSEQNNFELNGRNNSKAVLCDGVRLECVPIQDYTKEIAEALHDGSSTFPFEYYIARFSSFAGLSYSGYKKCLRHLVVDSTQINNEYATREYTKAIYAVHTDALDRNRHENLYRKSKGAFEEACLADVNAKLSDYKFAVRTNPKSNLSTDLVITEGEIPIENKGKGRQCLVKTEFALRRNEAQHNIDVLLLEEPENHLSHTHTRRLILRMVNTQMKQLFIATHSSMIATRLDLRHAILLNSAGTDPVVLQRLAEDTAKFFMKAPDNNLLEFVLSERVILVEGDAEYILLDALYRNHADGSSPDKDGVHIISVGGTSFKRYLQLASLLKVRTAVLRDNDGDYESNCQTRYSGFVGEHIQVFSDKNNERSTFEISLYQDNQTICEETFSEGRKKLSVQDYMLGNKADAAFALLEQHANRIVAPGYIQEAIAWIKR